MVRRYAGWVLRVAGWRPEESYRRNIFYLSASRLISTVGAMAAYVALVAVVYDRSGHSDRGVSEGFRLVASSPALRLTLLATSAGLLALLIATRIPPRRREAAGSGDPAPGAPKPSRRGWSLATALAPSRARQPKVS